MKKTGGIVAIVAGSIGLIVVGIGTMFGLMLAPIMTSDIGTIQAIGFLGVLCVLFFIAIIWLGRAASKGNRTSAKGDRLVGGLLIVSAIAATTLSFNLVIALLMAQVVVGAAMVLLDKRSPDDPRSPAA